MKQPTTPLSAILSLLVLLGCPSDKDPQETGSPGPDTSDTGKVLDTSDPGVPLPQNVVFILTDDQQWQTLWAMPNVQERLVGEGVVFENAFITTPLCCPARASLLAGGMFAHESGVLANDEPNGSMTSFDDSLSMGVRFQEAGYRTAHIGKYLNGYSDMAPYIPPGWDLFVSPLVHDDWSVYEVSEGSSGSLSSTGTIQDVEMYFSEYVTDRAVEWLQEDPDTPFFLWVTHFAPHYPSTAATEYNSSYAGEIWREGAFNEADISDKPSHWQENDLLTDDDIETGDRRYQNGLEALLSVDDSVGALLDALESSGRLEDTLFVLTSDNGFLHGEHRVYSKAYPYQESLRVPLVMRLPGGVVGTNDEVVAANLDISATFFALAGLDDAPTSGSSLLPLAQGESVSWREQLLIEGYNLSGAPTYAGLVSDEWKYIEYASGEFELYDLFSDPIEDLNRYGEAAYSSTIEALATDLDAVRGLAVAQEQVEVSVGEAVSQCIQVWGGVAPYTWTIVAGGVPTGLTLGEDGCLSGQLDSAGGSMVEVLVTDSSVSPYHGGPQTHDAVLWVGAVSR